MPFHLPLHHVYWVASYLLPLLKAQIIYYAQVQPSNHFIMSSIYHRFTFTWWKNVLFLALFISFYYSCDIILIFKKLYEQVCFISGYISLIMKSRKRNCQRWGKVYTLAGNSGSPSSLSWVIRQDCIWSAVTRQEMLNVGVLGMVVLGVTVESFFLFPSRDGRPPYRGKPGTPSWCCLWK
jgi:hypothetical protein